MNPVEVPVSLRRWFVGHFWADILFGVPLLIFPAWTLEQFGWAVVDPITARLVGAALLGIGTESLLGRNGSVESFRGMLRLKIGWSLAANFGIATSLLQGGPVSLWLFQGVFLGFSCLWIFYLLRLR